MTPTLKIYTYYFGIILIIFLGCNNKHINTPLFTQIENSGIQFTNQITDIEKYNIFNYRNYYNGGGVAIGDLNNDGLSDVFFVANQEPNKLFLNKGNFVFEDISLKAGFGKKLQWSTGVVLVDINHDGWLDIYISNAGNMLDSSLRANQLFINNHNLTFTETAAKYGLDHCGYTTQVSFFDYDMDGDLDCFMVDNSPIPVNTINNINARHIRAENSPVGNILKGGGDHLFKNENGFFKEVSAQAGIHGSLISLGLGVTVSDINNDGWLDIYVSNDFFERDYLYINQHNGTFKDLLEENLQHTSLASMGADIADINNDGYPDIFTTDMLPEDNYRIKTNTTFDNFDVYNLKLNNGFYHQYMQNTLQVNNGNGQFKEIAQYAGVEASDWSWGALFFDADNDGLNDIYVCNGIKHDLTNQDFIDFFSNEIIQKMVVTGKKEEVNTIIDKMPSTRISNKMFKNNGNFKFTNVADEWGLQTPSFSNGAGYGDLDNDGDLDLIVNNVNQPAFIYKNNSKQLLKNHYIKFVLQGQDKNTFAIGSKVYVYANNQILSREIIPSRGFESSIDYATVIGLGNCNKIDSVQIVWADLTTSTLYNILVDSFYKIAYNQLPHLKFIPKNQFEKTILTEEKNPFLKHQENDQIDFYAERNIPKMLSREGPKAAIADVNKDGLLDIFIGGANNVGGQLYLQNKTGNFILSKQQAFVDTKNFEDIAVSFFDANNDGNVDLFIGAGGNKQIGESGLLEHRLFLNDGKGNFTLLQNAFPHNDFDVSCVVPFDFDNDGDIDLFVGSRNTTYRYGVIPTSHIYENNGHGIFVDKTAQVAPSIEKIGMVTNAIWGHILNNKTRSLIIVGEWMHPFIFTYKQGKFEEEKTNLQDLFGWWQTVEIGDINNDGMEDLIMGNLGENGYLRPTLQNPCKLWVSDFDGNGSIDKIITKSINNKDYTVFLKRDIDEQLPSLKKQNLKFESFAQKTFQQLFTEEQIKKATMHTFNYCSSIVAYNKGNGQFDIEKLPPEIQFSSVNAIKLLDVDNDKKIDIITAGNQLNFVPQFGRLDASFGNIILNKGNKQLQVVSDKKSGLHILGQVNDMALILNNKSTLLLFLINNNKPVMYSIKK